MAITGYVGSFARTISFVGSVEGSSRAINAQTHKTTVGASNGDLCVICIFGVAGGVSPATTPSGWTLASGLYYTSPANYVSAIFYKILDGSEVSTNFMHSGATSYATSTLFFSGVRNTTHGSIEAEATVFNPAAHTISIASLTKPVIGLALAATYTPTFLVSHSFFNSFSPSADTTITQDSSGSTQARIEVKFKIYNDEPQDITCDIPDYVTSGGSSSFYMQSHQSLYFVNT